MKESYSFSPLPETTESQRAVLTDRETESIAKLGLTPDDLANLLHGQPFAEGSYALVFESTNTDPSVVAKVWKNPKQDSHRATNEHVALRFLRKRHFENSPRLRSYLEAPPILFEDKSEGKALEHHDKESLRRLASALANLHSVRLNKYGKNLTERKPGTRMDFFRERVEALRESLDSVSSETESSAFIRRGLDKIAKDAERSRDAFSDDFFTLIHFDLNPSNILYSEKEDTLTIIDWEQASAGDNAMDIAKLFLKSEFSSEQKQEFLEEYEKALEEKDGSLRERLHVYEPLVLMNSLLWRLRVLKDEPEHSRSESEGQFYQRVKVRLEQEMEALKVYLTE